MKGKLKVIPITLVLLIIATGVLLWRMSAMSKDLADQQESALSQERDLLSEQEGKAIDGVKDIDIIPLYLTGDQKNVVTTQFDSVSDIYSVAKSEEANQDLQTIKKNKTFDIKNAMWAYNPYGTNVNSMVVCFQTSGKCYCRYTISVKDEDIPDFTRSAVAYGSEKLTKNHEYQLIGLVTGKTNYITLSLYNSNDELSESYTFSVDIPESEYGAQQKLKTTTGISKETLTNGLFVVFSTGSTSGNADGKKKSAKTGKKQNEILMYDNSGVLRCEIPTEDDIAKNVEVIYDTLVYAVSDKKIVQVNSLGQVTNVMRLGSYTQSGEFTYDGSGNIFVIATAAKKKSAPDSKVLKVNIESGEVTLVADMDEILPDVYQDAVLASGKDNVDWIGLNSLCVLDANTLLVSSKNLSSLFKIENIGSLMTDVEYIIADKSIYKSYKKLRKKVLTKTSEEPVATETPVVDNMLETPKTPEPFTAQYGQEAIDCVQDSETGTLTVTMLNSNTGTGADENGESYYYVYEVNEAAGTYELVESKALDQTAEYGNVFEHEDNLIYCCSDESLFTETDADGKLICQYDVSTKPYRVYKEDFKDFWFY